MKRSRGGIAALNARLRPALSALLLGLLLLQPAVAKETPVRARPQGAVIASAHHLATDAGHEILAKGGNAFDAAVAVSAALSVVEPYSSGLGGGGFYLLHNGKTGAEVMLDARETAPASATPARYLDAQGELDRDKAQNGPMSAGIPGLPAGLVQLAKKYGRLPLAASLAPAIRLAEQGFDVHEHMVSAYAERKDVMERFAGTRKVYLADGDAPEMGEMFVQPELAHTLRLLASQGFDGFYRGETARKIVADVNKHGGAWTAQDLSGYMVKERAPVRFKYRDWNIVTAPPPSSGGVALAEILQMLEGWDLVKLDPAHRVHILAEAMRRAYRDRTLYLGDPDFVQMPIARLVSDDYAAGLRASILPEQATPSAMLPGGKPPLEGEHTTHFSIIDADGNLVAATQTVNLSYGSGMVAEGTGVLLNDEMDDFALKPGTPNAFGVMGYDANAVKAGKRMLSSMTPSFMIGKNQVAVLGTPGGSRIITMVLLGMLAVEDGMDPQQMTALPRFHHQYLPDTIYLEPNALPLETIQALNAMGHATEQGSRTWGNMQAVDWNLRTGALRGGSDPRNPVGSARVVPVKVKHKP